MTYAKNRYWRLRNNGLCTWCETPVKNRSYCVECAAARAESSRTPGLKEKREEIQRRVIDMYCGRLLRVHEMANQIGLCESAIIRRINNAGVARSAGAGIHLQYVPWIDEALQMRCEGMTYAQIAEKVGYKYESNLSAIINRWRDARQPWVDAALIQHRSGVPWSRIADDLGRDIDDVRIFVSRRAAYIRGSLANDSAGMTVPVERMQR